MPSNRQKDFIAEIKTLGLSRTNRFLVYLTPPSAEPANVRKTLLFCEKASLPGINYATTQNRSFGESREVPYDKLFDPVTLTFHVDREMKVKKMFDDWINYIQNPGNRSFQWYRNYISDLVIQVQDLQDKTTYEVSMFEAYPKSMGSVQLDAESKDTMRLDVTFQYKYWMSSTISEQANGQLLTADGVNKYTSDFTGFQERFRKGLGEGGNFLTGAVGQIAQRSFSQVTSRIPSIKF
jgi:hypothetical protein